MTIDYVQMTVEIQGIEDEVQPIDIDPNLTAGELKTEILEEFPVLKENQISEYALWISDGVRPLPDKTILGRMPMRDREFRIIFGSVDVCPNKPAKYFPFPFDYEPRELPNFMQASSLIYEIEQDRKHPLRYDAYLIGREQPALSGNWKHTPQLGFEVNFYKKHGFNIDGLSREHAVIRYMEDLFYVAQLTRKESAEAYLNGDRMRPPKVGERMIEYVFYPVQHGDVIHLGEKRQFGMQLVRGTAQ